MSEFVDDVLNGLIETFSKSEEPVEDDGPLKKIVAINFEEIVMNPSKDVFVFYIPKAKRFSTW